MSGDRGPSPQEMGLSERDRAMMGIKLNSEGAGLSEKDKKRMQSDLLRIGVDAPRAEYATNYQYTPRELKFQELLKLETAAHRERQKEAKTKQLREYFDQETAVRVRDMQEGGESEEAVRNYQARREAKKEQYVAAETQEIMELWDRQSREADIRKRITDMERSKPENVDGALHAVDRLWGAIDQALNEQALDHRRHGLPEESKIDKEWADMALQVLNDLRDQLRFEGSYPGRMNDALQKLWDGTWSESAARGRKHIEQKWKDGIRTLWGALGGDRYTETPTQEWERRVNRDKRIDRS